MPDTATCILHSVITVFRTQCQGSVQKWIELQRLRCFDTLPRGVRHIGKQWLFLCIAVITAAIVFWKLNFASTITPPSEYSHANLRIDVAYYQHGEPIRGLSVVEARIDCPAMPTDGNENILYALWPPRLHAWCAHSFPRALNTRATTDVRGNVTLWFHSTPTPRWTTITTWFDSQLRISVPPYKHMFFEPEVLSPDHWRLRLDWQCGQTATITSSDETDKVNRWCWKSL